MEQSEKKRVRSANWDEEEKRLLRQLIIERIDVIENKDTSTNTNSLKKAAWQEVLSCFNSLNTKKRDLKELLTQWRNTKGKVKSRDSEYKRAKLKTGGGPPPPSPPAEDLIIIEALPNEFVIDSNCFDSDSLYNNTLSQSTHDQEARKKTECDDPWTPLPAPSNDIKEVEEIPADVDKQDTNKTLTATPKLQNMYQKKYKKQHKKINNVDENNYEQELFMLVKKAKEREMEHAEEIHKKRLEIMDLEYDYWKKKNNIE